MGGSQLLSLAGLSTSLWLALSAHLAWGADFAVKKINAGVEVSIDEQLFCQYHVKSGRQPAIWPIIGPGGQALTRAYPLGPAGEQENKDHPHHRSLWFSHGIVNGLDFWAAHGADEGKPQNQIVHQEFAAAEVRDGQAYLVTRNNWVSAEGETVCSDERTIWMGADEKYRWIDYTTRLIASEGEVTFGDTKEGTFAVRVAGTMKVEAEKDNFFTIEMPR